MNRTARRLFSFRGLGIAVLVGVGAAWNVAAFGADASSNSFRSENGSRTALQPAVVTLPLSAPNDALAFSITPGSSKPFTRITLEFAGGRTQTLILDVQSQVGKRLTAASPATADASKKSAKAPAKPVYEEATAPDSLTSIQPLNVRLFAKPNLYRYTDPQQDELFKKLDGMPGASQTFTHYEFRNRGDRPELWINGCYAGEFSLGGVLRQVKIALPAGASIRDEATYRLPSTGEAYCVLDMARIAKPGAMRGATVSPAKGLRRLRGVPMLVTDGDGNGDCGVVRQMKGSWALECDEHLSRTPFDGMPETLHFSVPQAYYHRAYVLCAVEPDAAKEPVLTVRMTRFARSGRGDAMTHAAVRLPRDGETPASNLTPVGRVAYTAGGKSVETPLYLAAIDLDPGAILDLIESKKDPQAPMLNGHYLDIDLLGRIEGVKPVPNSRSAVHVFGLTLERCPASFTAAAKQPGNIFYNDQTPETVAVVRAAEPCRLTLAWRITDVKGALVREGSEPLDFSAAGEEQRRTIDLQTSQPGWYGLRYTLIRRDDKRKTPPFFTHDAAFALLGPDRRKAGYESPYGAWWFGGAHHGCDDREIVGPLLHKAGLRKTTFGWTKYAEADFAPWKVTLNQIGWMFNPKESAENNEKKIAAWVKKFPHCKSILIFHESYGNYLPAELFGEKPKEEEAAVTAARKRVETATAAAKLYREKFPELKIIVGNTSASAAIIASLLRHGFDPAWIDYIGIETAAGQTGMPEKLWDGGPQGAYLSRDVSRRFGRELPVTGCYEYTSRCERNLGPQRHAEFYVRDVLLAHAYRYHHISPGLLYDAGNSYNHTLWGGSGLCRRYPLLYPKPAYAAMAAVTSALDQVTFRRKVPTGSLTVYALEFDRADGRRSYALWTPRASVEAALEFPDGVRLERTGFYGDVSSPATQSGRLTLTVESAPQYLTADRPLKSVQVVRGITEPTPDGFHAADKLDGAVAWRIVKDETLTKKTGELPLHIPGKFDLRRAKDDERGDCLELELHGDAKLSDYIGEYCAIAPDAPAAIPGEPHTLGLWVRGNSSWGKVVFEFEDAAGAVRRTHAGEWHDWQGELSINFDGWHFIRFPIDAKSPVVYSSPGGRCQRTKGSGDAVVYPIRVTKLYFVMNRRALDPTEMQPVPPTIRLRDVGGY